MHIFICKSFVCFQMYIRSESYVFIYTHAFYFYLWHYHLCATSYIHVRSAKVLCLSACTSSFIHLPNSFNLTFHLRCEIWLRHYIYYQDKPCAFCDCQIHNLGKTIANNCKLLLILWYVSLSVPLSVYSKQLDFIS